jgi:predicted RNase H-like nuclease (RuvC/YqgF family)
MELIDIINRVQPDIIHLEEIPEFFMDSEKLLNKLYKLIEHMLL